MKIYKKIKCFLRVFKNPTRREMLKSNRGFHWLRRGVSLRCLSSYFVEDFGPIREKDKPLSSYPVFEFDAVLYASIQCLSRSVVMVMIVFYNDFYSKIY